MAGRWVAWAMMLALLAGCAPWVASVGPDIRPPALNESAIDTADGARLPLLTALPAAPQQIRAAVVALHGFNDYSNTYAELAPFLAQRGIAVYAYDQRGFGGAPQPGDWFGTPRLIADANQAVRLVRQRHPGVKVFVMGESMGGAVALAGQTASAPLADGLILSAPAVWGRASMGAVPRVALWLGAHLLPWLPVSGQKLPVQASDNIAMLRALGRDPKVLKQTTISTLHGLVDLMDAAVEAAPALQVPALILYGGRDDIIPKEATCRVLTRLPPDRVRIAYYPDGYHLLFRDLKAAAIWQDIADWIHQPLFGSSALPPFCMAS